MTTCPVCASASVSSGNRFSATSSEAAQHFVLAEADTIRHRTLKAHIESLWSAPACTMMSCNNCGLGFAQPFVAGDAEFYNLAYPFSDYPQDKWEFAVTLKALEQLETKDMRCIEVGAGFGHFLNKVSPRFFRADHTTAIEYNSVAGRRLTQGGFNLVNLDVRSEAFASAESAFDFVFMFQVLEHMDDLASLTKRLRYITSDGAHIFIAVPNPARIAFNERSSSLLDMPPNHISLWTRQALEQFALQLGFDLVNFLVEPLAWSKLIRQDLVYSFMRRSQRHGSLENRLRSRPRSRLRLLAEAALALCAIPVRIPSWIRAMTSGQQLGGSIWVSLRKR